MSITLERRENCAHCEKHASMISTECYGCWVRYCSRLMKSSRQALYYSVQAIHGKEILEQFVNDVTAYLREREAAGAPR